MSVLDDIFDTVTGAAPAPAPAPEPPIGWAIPTHHSRCMVCSATYHMPDQPLVGYEGPRGATDWRREPVPASVAAQPPTIIPLATRWLAACPRCKGATYHENYHLKHQTEQISFEGPGW